MYLPFCKIGKFMDYKETLEYINSLGKFRLPPGLSRMKEVCGKLNNPQDRFKSIHIAGTNGKGSTAAMTANILSQSGRKVGLYISPFVVNFRERIQINGEYISETDLVKYSRKVIDTAISLNEFEFITAVAFLYFSEKNIDVAVIETGLGGKFDATNVIKNVCTCVITKIGLDHTAVLGETIEKITEEKCGIIKTKKTVTVPDQNPKALSVIENYAEETLIPEFPEIHSSSLKGTKFVFEGREYEIHILGKHQVLNAVTAITAVRSSPFNVSYEDIKTALENTRFPARLEVVSEKPLTVIDGAHNPDGAEVLSKFLKQFNEKPTFIIAMMKDKDCDSFLSKILPYADTCIITKIENPRCMDVGDLSALATKYTKNIIKTDNLADAIKRAKSSKNSIFIVGSLYLASDARKYYI